MVISDKSSYEDSDSEPDDDNDDVGDEVGDNDAEQKPLLEDWVSWIKRATHIAEEELQKANVTDWVREQRSRYWDFAGRIASCKDSRWSHAILNWIPEGGFRNVGSPRKRWKDDISAFCSSTSGEYCSEWFVLV